MTREEEVKQLENLISESQKRLRVLKEDNSLHFARYEYRKEYKLNDGGSVRIWADNMVTIKIRDLCRAIGSAKIQKACGNNWYVHFNSSTKVKDIPHEKIKVLNKFIENIYPFVMETVIQVLAADGVEVEEKA